MKIVGATGLVGLA